MFPLKWVKGSRPSSQDAQLARSLVAAEWHAYIHRSTANIQSTTCSKTPNAQAAETILYGPLNVDIMAKDSGGDTRFLPCEKGV